MFQGQSIKDRAVHILNAAWMDTIWDKLSFNVKSSMLKIQSFRQTHYANHQKPREMADFVSVKVGWRPLLAGANAAELVLRTDAVTFARRANPFTFERCCLVRRGEGVIMTGSDEKERDRACSVGAATIYI